MKFDGFVVKQKDDLLVQPFFSVLTIWLEWIDLLEFLYQMSTQLFSSKDTAKTLYSFTFIFLKIFDTHVSNVSNIYLSQFFKLCLKI